MNANKDTQKRLQTLQRFGVGTGVAGAAVMASQAHALDVTNALSNSDASSNIDIAALFILGVVVVIWSAKRVIAFFGR